MQAGLGGWYNGRPGIAVDSTGNIHAVYAGDNDGNKPRYSKRIGTTWSSGVVIDSSANCDGGFARIACGPDGTVHAAYYTSGMLKHAKNSGSGWQLREIDTMDEWSGPDVAVDQQSVLHFAYGKAKKLAYLRVPPYQQLTIGASPVGAGTTVPPPGVYFYERGTTASLTALASNGWVFDGWSGDVQGTNSSVLVTNATDKLVTANFRPRRIIPDVQAVNVPEGGVSSFRLKLDSPPGGSIVVAVARLDGETNVVVQSGSALTFDATSWNTFQTVVLASAPDSDVRDGMARIKCSAVGWADAVVSANHRDAQFWSILVETNVVVLPEGGNATVRIKLGNPPETNLVVSVDRAYGSPIVTVQSGATLTFGPSNWDVYQAATIAAAMDDNFLDDQAAIRCAAPGWTGNDVSVTQLDNGMPPFITSQPLSVAVVVGSNALFGVSATSATPLAYQWRKSDNNIPGATNATLLLTNIQPADGGYFTVVITNRGGGVTSSPPAVLLVSVPPAITLQPVTQTAVRGTTVTFTVAAAGTQPIGYRWRLNGTNLCDGGRVAGALQSTLIITNVQGADAGDYTVVVSNFISSVTSQPSAVLTVLVPPSVAILPERIITNLSRAVSFEAVATGSSPLTYQWAKNSSVLVGKTNALLVFTGLSSFDSGYYSVTVSNVAGKATSDPALLLVSEVDSDGDGLNNGDEFNVWHTDPFNSDTDGDHVTDWREVQDGTDPLNPASFRISVIQSAWSLDAGGGFVGSSTVSGISAIGQGCPVGFTSGGGLLNLSGLLGTLQGSVLDSDGDGLTDEDERDRFGTNPYARDTYGDGMSDYDELIAGTSPTNRTDIFRATSMSSSTNRFVLWWNTAPGRLYTVSTTPNLVASWSNVFQVLGDGSPKSYTNTDVSSTSRFFRIRVDR